MFLPATIRRNLEHRPNLLRILENMGWLTLDKVLRIGVGLIMAVLVARHLGPEMFGALSFALAFVGIAGPLASLGLKQIVVRDLVKEPGTTAEILGTAAAMRAIAGVLTYAVLIGAIFLLRPEDGLAIGMVIIIGLIVVVQVSEIASFWFESQVLSKYTVLATGIAFAIFTIVRIVLLLLEAPVVAFATATSAEAAVASCLVVAIFFRKGHRPLSLNVNRDRARRLLWDSWPLFLSGIAVIIYMRIDQIMLGQMLDVGAVGVYSVAVKISEAWYFVPTIIVASVFPALIASREHNQVEYYARLQRLFDLLVWLAIAIAVPITLLATPLVIILFGEAYSDAGPVLTIHVWASVFVAIGLASGKWYVLEGRQILSFQRTALGVVINVGLNVLLIPRLGVSGAAWATLISYSVAGFWADLTSHHTRRLFWMKVRTLWPRRVWR